MSISSIFSPRQERKSLQVTDSLIERAFQAKSLLGDSLCIRIETPQKIRKQLGTRYVCFLDWSALFSSDLERLETIKKTYRAFFQSIENSVWENKISLPFYFSPLLNHDENILDCLCDYLAEKSACYLNTHPQACLYVHFNPTQDWTKQAAHFIYACRHATALLPARVGKRIRITIKPLTTYKPHTCALYVQKNFLCPSQTLSEEFLEETRRITYEKEYTERGNSPYLRRRVPSFLKGENPSETNDADL